MSDVVVDDDGAARVVSLVGEHDIGTAPRLARELELAGHARRATVVELLLTTFIDSSVLATLVSALRHAQADGLGFTFVVHDDGPDAVSRILQLTGLLGAFPVYRTRAAARGAALEGVNRVLAFGANG